MPSALPCLTELGLAFQEEDFLLLPKGTDQAYLAKVKAELLNPLMVQEKVQEKVQDSLPGMSTMTVEALTRFLKLMAMAIHHPAHLVAI